MTAKTLRLDQFIPYRLSFTAALLRDTIAQSYERLFGISIAEWRVIAWVAELGSVTQQQLCARSRMDKVTVSRAAIALRASPSMDCLMDTRSAPAPPAVSRK